MSAKAKIRAIRLANEAVNTLVLLVILLLLVFGCYAMWDSKQVYRAADAMRYEIYKPNPEDGGLSFRELQAINPEVFAWLTVYGTNIDYPVVQGEDNLKYVNTDAEGWYSLSGAIFLDCHNSADFSDFSSILYGHHMQNGSMFGSLQAFNDASFFAENKTGTLVLARVQYEKEWFAFVVTQAKDDVLYTPGVESGPDKQSFLEHVKRIARHARDLEITQEDRLISLSTCNYEF
ncbi:MAG: class B sortase, partial [Clostridiales bacterium]|nr:class B sortase [Clostridiales bacterium]